MLGAVCTAASSIAADAIERRAENLYTPRAASPLLPETGRTARGSKLAMEVVHGDNHASAVILAMRKKTRSSLATHKRDAGGAGTSIRARPTGAAAVQTQVRERKLLQRRQQEEDACGPGMRVGAVVRGPPFSLRRVVSICMRHARAVARNVSTIF